MRPFEGIKVLDCTHVLAGPFAAYQLGVLGADVIKVDDPNEPDQSRESGADHALNQAMMGTGFLTQGSNKRAIALNLKTEGGREAFVRLVVEWADVLVENYRPGAFKALGLGYEDLASLKPTLIYASMTAFGQGGPRGTQTAYDHAIQATSGITASTGTEASGPIKAGAPMVDYATGTMGAFAISAALFQRMRTGQGQHIDLAMLDVAMILQGSHITDYLHSGHHPRRNGNVMRFAASSAFPTKDGLVQLAASNARQHRRFYEAIGDPEEAKRAACRSATSATRRSWLPSPRRCRRRPPTSGRRTSRAGTCPPRACASCAKRLPIRTCRPAACCTATRRCRASTSRSPCRWPHSSSRTTGRRSSDRRRVWASIPTRCWRRWATRPSRSRR